MGHKASEFYRDDLTAHDPLCSWPDQFILRTTCAECTLIAKVRADERERIARAIEDKVPMPPGDKGPWEDEFYRHAYLDAARLAREGHR